MESGYTLWNLNFSRTVAGITKWFWVTIEGYLSYLLPKFKDLVPTNLGSGAIWTRRKCVTVTADYCSTLPATSITFCSSFRCTENRWNAALNSLSWLSAKPGWESRPWSTRCSCQTCTRTARFHQSRNEWSERRSCKRRPWSVKGLVDVTCSVSDYYTIVEFRERFFWNWVRTLLADTCAFSQLYDVINRNGRLIHCKFNSVK